MGCVPGGTGSKTRSELRSDWQAEAPTPPRALSFYEISWAADPFRHACASLVERRRGASWGWGAFPAGQGRKHGPSFARIGRRKRLPHQEHRVFMKSRGPQAHSGMRVHLWWRGGGVRVWNGVRSRRGRVENTVRASLGLAGGSADPSKNIEFI